ncbi:tetratricopeptide repeat protein 19, mitochondrial [Anoplopoma fimbria]|uniref:tetratricopeptide repeat protein 19, mitochondrial n=1 Tax=Anoplopoma fimbria TaxID=229290 RepID=UPI0023EDBCE8|nr:tetratricopeptide repeat protein 19, mitochondrial [Anoplopoma fimbria]
MAACSVRRALLSLTLSRVTCSGGHVTLRGSPGSAVTSSKAVEWKRSACWVKESRHESIWTKRGGAGGAGGGGGGGGAGGVLWAAVAFSLFRSSDEDQRDEAQRKEDEIILLLKKAKLSVSRGQLQAASGLLHQAVVLAHQTHNLQAVVYTYSLMANLAYVQGQLDHAEKLFKAAMSFMLSGGTPQDDNAVIEMSLKLATIYAEQNKAELAEHGFRFCTESLGAKLQKQKESAAEEQTEEQEALRKETRLLLGLCLDSRARYRASTLHLKLAGQDYQNALDICRQEQGDTHPQTLVLMSDLATILDLQGRHDDALALVQQAVELSRSVGHPDQHVLLGNMAGILLHKGRLEDSVRFYQEALSLARQAGDQEAVDKIQEGLQEVKKRRNQERKEDGEAAQ